jgi:hypothetical protein
LSPPDNLQDSQPIFVDPKSTLDNWNNLPKRTTKQNEQINTRPIHYGDVKSTIDNWQETKKSYPRLRQKLLHVNINYSNFNEKSFYLSRHQKHQ